MHQTPNVTWGKKEMNKEKIIEKKKEKSQFQRKCLTEMQITHQHLEHCITTCTSTKLRFNFTTWISRNIVLCVFIE